MDIQVSSNFERLLFELLDRNATATAACMQGFRETGCMRVPDASLRQAGALFQGFRLDDSGTEAEIRRLYQEMDYLADPHSAIGIAAARARALPDIPMVAMATAHPAKFPDAMMCATGMRPPLPSFLADLHEREEHFTVVPNDLHAIQAVVRNQTNRLGLKL
jgi:threonine synthase